MKFLRVFCLVVASFVAQGAGPIPYAPAPNDTYFDDLWHLEGLATDTVRYAIDINARSAWSFSRGAGVTIAIVDDGVELHHPELTNRANPALHWNFDADVPAGNHPTNYFLHGTPVAGLAVAEGNNNRGVIGVAPEARLASWVIYRTNGNFVSSNQLAKMFTFHPNEVQVQNHSWVKAGIRRVTMSDAESLAISNAVYHGRSGLGVVMIRASGNDRQAGRNANDDAYTSDPRVVVVGGIRPDGRVASYSTPGASILVAAPGGETDAPLMSTDRLGELGYNQIGFTNDLADYVFSSFGFSGTSAAAPLVSGLSALILSANPTVTVRDVQHILAQAAFQPDVNDPDLLPNGAGFLVSHNTGFGTVNGGSAAQLATLWSNVPAAIGVTNTVQEANAIPDAGLRLVISGAGVPSELQSIVALPSLGIHSEGETATVPLVYVGQALTPLTTNLMGKAALIQRGGGDFSLKIQHAADAGAEFAIIFNNQGSTALQVLGGTDFVPIPAISISQRDGDALVAFMATNTVQARIDLETLDYEFSVTNALITEHVLVHLDHFHEARGDMRVTLVSPKGTRSVLQRLGQDISRFDGRWTYMTTHHFYESPVGTWRLEVSDESTQAVGAVREATLEVRGIPIVDLDTDGLDDVWEVARIGGLASGPADDPDNDGYSNAREQIQGKDPRVNDSPLQVDLSKWNESYIRLNWPARNGVTYEVLGATDVTQAFQVLATVPGGFPRAAWFGTVDTRYKFFTVREKAL